MHVPITLRNVPCPVTCQRNLNYFEDAGIIRHTLPGPGGRLVRGEADEECMRLGWWDVSLGIDALYSCLILSASLGCGS